MLTSLVCIALVSCLLLLFFVIRAWLKKEARPVFAHEVEQVSLKDLSLIWTRPIEKEIGCFADLSRYQLSSPTVDKPEPHRTRPEFRYEEIARFYRERVDGKPFFLKDVRNCAEDILKLLDEAGECPSVVNRNSREPEKLLNTDIYDLLKQIPLYRHSLNVAMEITRLCKQEAVVPKAVIAGLAHDLGKIPSFQDKAYATGDHPHIAPMVLGTLESFNKLPFADDIIEAIRCHHRPNPELDLAQKLKDADQASRNNELALLLKAEKRVVTVETGQRNEEQDNPGGEEIDAHEVIFGSGGEVDRDIFGSEGREDERIVNRMVEIGWFDPHAALIYIKQFINRMKGGRFAVISMPDGYVYVEAFFFWNVAKKLSRGDTRLLLADADIQTRRNIMFSMVERLKQETNAIAVEFLGERYFMARFTINPESDTPRELCFIPFLACAFGEPVSNLEARKIARLREIVKIVPKHRSHEEAGGAGSGARLSRGR